MKMERGFPVFSVWPHLFHGAGHEKKWGEQLKWPLIFRLYIWKFSRCTATRTSSYSLVGPSVFFYTKPRFMLCLFICAFWFVCVSPSFYVSLGSWVISLTVLGASVTNLNEKALRETQTPFPGAQDGQTCTYRLSILSLRLCFACSFVLFELFVCPHSFVFPLAVESSPLQILALA